MRSTAAAIETSAEIDTLIARALTLPPALRQLVAQRIWESLEPAGQLPIDAEQMSEIVRRSAEIQAGTAELVDGKQVIANARKKIAAARRAR